MTPFDLRNLFLNAIPLELGTYTYANQATMPAICVGDIPNDVVVDGLELILPIFAHVISSQQYGDTFHHRCERWDTTFVLHSKDKDLLFNAIDKCHRFFSRSSGTYIAPSHRHNSLPQYCFTIIYSEGYKK